ncbi:hypothetical protein CRG98_021046 [Punica granatum]|uniref:Uncharacterized protein n=1 Tax=Punica granatum TaxID=22663 RepID=A0A2I0JRR6_PUNGR|nr:hypothetical protein CRG98_021046 [Punica granatum]
MRMRSHFRRPQCEGSKAPVGHARAYRDILNDALATLSIIRRARRLRTLLVKLGVCFVPRVFVGNSLTLHCMVALVCLALFRDQGCPGMSVERGCPGLRGLRWTPFLTVSCRSRGGCP